MDEDEESGDISQLWMVPYADLMSILVIFFLALFGFAYMGRQTGYERAVAYLQKEMSGDAEALRKLEQKEIEAKAAEVIKKELETLPKDQVSLTVDSQRLKVTLGGGVVFRQSSAELKPEAKEVLARVAAALKDIPDSVVVAGHTDSVPANPRRGYSSNWELSAARAFAVIDFFVSQGLPAQRFSALGYAANKPVAPNDTPEGRLRNRRIEIFIQRQA